MKKTFMFLMLSLMFCGMALAQRTITGNIADNSGLALIGANVTVKGTTIGVITDIDGNYSIQIPGGDQTLVFSYTGFNTQEIAVGSETTLNVVLAEGVLLNEVVKVGYSDVARNKMISSVAQVNADKIENVPLTDVNQLLQGNAAGVYTTANSGQPGSAQQVRIRGIGSLSSGSNPLYVVDGVIMSQGNFSQLDGANATDVLAQFNPNDIQNITVLKDASATALYGSRGANGVVLITTKRGKAGKTDLNAKFQYGTTSPSFGNFELMSAQQQWDYEREILANSGQTQAQIDGRRPASLLNETADWLDIAFRDGKTLNAELQASGGNEKTRFFISGGYFDQEGILFESKFNRTSARANIDHTATDKLTFSANINASYSENANAVSGNRFQSPIAAAFTTTPMQSPYKADGTLYTGLEDDWGAAVIGDNFLYSLPLNPVGINTFRFISKIEANYDIIDNLKFTQSANIDWINIDEIDFDDPTTNDGVNDNGTITNSFTKNRTYTTQSLLKYFADFGSDHSIDILGGFEFQGSDFETFNAGGKGLASGKLKTLNSTAEANFVGGSKTKYAFVSYLSQVNYSFRDKYLLSASIRRDGSSRFGQDNRWANFWSVGGAWNITDESFLSDSGLFDDLRLRGSYGTAGNAAIGNFPSQELYGFGAAYLNSPGSTPTQIANPILTWEESSTLNVGLDFGILDNKVSGSVEYYVKNSNANLLNVPVSSTSGFTSALRNIGEIQNSGVEVTFNITPIASFDNGFAWNISGNFSANDNKIVALPEGEDINAGNLQVWREGLPIRSFFMQKWAGVNPADGTPLWFTEEGGVTGSYSQADRIIVGNATPDFTAGLTNTFSYRGVTLSTFFYTAQGNEIYNGSKGFLDSDGRRFGWVHITDALDHWKQPGDISERPLPLSGGNSGAANTSTRYLEDGSFIRLRNVLLGYRLPSSLTDKLKLGSVNIYAQGVNLWTMTDYSGIDPEADEDGNEFFRYPVGKSVTFGIDIKF
jgi:TonB-linked SusC/RagA family outer membrane protein